MADRDLGEALDRIEINENSIVQLDANITQNLANIEENEGRFKTNKENTNNRLSTLEDNAAHKEELDELETKLDRRPTSA
jgi:hypothetical protein